MNTYYTRTDIFNYNIKSNIKSNWEQYVKRNNLDYDYISNEDFENILKMI